LPLGQLGTWFVYLGVLLINYFGTWLNQIMLQASFSHHQEMLRLWMVSLFETGRFAWDGMLDFVLFVPLPSV
jgi:hypothetical protein